MLTYRTIGGVLDFYMFLGPEPENVIQQYTHVNKIHFIFLASVSKIKVIWSYVLYIQQPEFFCEVVSFFYSPASIDWGHAVFALSFCP